MNSKTVPPTIVTHTNPDWDAIASAWLLKRFWTPLAMARFAFVNAGKPDPATMLQATAVVDTGLEFDAERLRFDHHQASVPRNVSATRQVYDFLLARVEDLLVRQRLEAIQNVIELVWQFDVGETGPAVEFSRVLGIHALLGGAKDRLRKSEPAETWDMAFLNAGMGILDDLSSVLASRAEAARSYASSVVYRSADGRVVGLRHGAAQLAYREGATLVVYEGRPFQTTEGWLSQPVGISRGFEDPEPHAGAVVAAILSEKLDLDAAIRGEMESWWQHPDGFYAGRGAAAAPNSTPITIDIAEIARLVDEIWCR